MLLKIWYLITLLLAALLSGTSFAHTLELPAKLHYDAAQWTLLQQTLYGAFAYVGGPIELAAILASLVLAVLLRDYRLSCLLTMAGAVCLMAAFFGVCIFITERVNAQIAMGGWAGDPCGLDAVENTLGVLSCGALRAPPGGLCDVHRQSPRARPRASFRISIADLSERSTRVHAVPLWLRHMILLFSAPEQ